jgi:interferon gamma-inducible protein 30
LPAALVSKTHHYLDDDSGPEARRPVWASGNAYERQPTSNPHHYLDFPRSATVRKSIAPQSLVATDKPAQDKAALATATATRAPGTGGASPAADGEDGDNWIRGIPLIGQSIADARKEAKMREPVRDEDRVSADQAPKVNVEMYIEAACPGCQFFTTHVLVPVLQEEGMADITDLNVIAAGNADFKQDEKSKADVVECQHGEGECEGNKIISCLAKEHQGDRKFVETLGCIEEHSAVASDVFSTLLSNLTASEMLRNNANICMKNNAIDPEKVDSCSSSPEGEQMLRDAIKRTKNLQPKFEYAPWVLVDGMPLRDDAYSLKKYICDSYTGPLPEACSSDKLKDYYPDGVTATLSASKERKDASQTSGLKEGTVRGSNRCQCHFDSRV